MTTLALRDGDGNVQAGDFHIKVPHNTSMLFALGGALRVQGGLQEGDEIVFDATQGYSAISADGTTKNCQQRLHNSKIYVHSWRLLSLQELSAILIRLKGHRDRMYKEMESLYEKMLNDKYSCAEVKGGLVRYKKVQGGLSVDYPAKGKAKIKNPATVKRYEHLTSSSAALRAISEDLDSLCLEMVKPLLPDTGYDSADILVVTSYGIRRVFQKAWRGWTWQSSGALYRVDALCTD